MNNIKFTGLPIKPNEQPTISLRDRTNFGCIRTALGDFYTWTNHSTSETNGIAAAKLGLRFFGLLAQTALCLTGVGIIAVICIQIELTTIDHEKILEIAETTFYKQNEEWYAKNVKTLEEHYKNKFALERAALIEEANKGSGTKNEEVERTLKAKNEETECLLKTKEEETAQQLQTKDKELERLLKEIETLRAQTAQAKEQTLSQATTQLQQLKIEHEKQVKALQENLDTATKAGELICNQNNQLQTQLTQKNEELKELQKKAQEKDQQLATYRRVDALSAHKPPQKKNDQTIQTKTDATETKDSTNVVDQDISFFI